MEHCDSFLRDKQCAAYLSIARSTFRRWVKVKPGFPQPIEFSDGVTVWSRDELNGWIASQKKMRSQNKEES